MYKINSPEKQDTTMPQVLTWLLSKLANPTYRDALIGDMEEEYSERRKTNRDAAKWLFRQTILAIWDGQIAMIKSTNFLKVLSLLLCLLVLPVIALFVGWLSNMEAPSEQLWQFLLAGEIHSIVLQSHYWKEAWYESGIAHIELAMFINIPSILWGLVFAGAAYHLLQKSTPPVWVFSVVALIYALLPYFFGYAVISALHPAAYKVGPILAFMILAPFFTLPMYVWFLFKRFPN